MVGPVTPVGVPSMNHSTKVVRVAPSLSSVTSALKIKSGVAAKAPPVMSPVTGYLGARFGAASVVNVLAKGSKELSAGSLMPPVSVTA